MSVFLPVQDMITRTWPALQLELIIELFLISNNGSLNNNVVSVILLSLQEVAWFSLVS